MKIWISGLLISLFCCANASAQWGTVEDLVVSPASPTVRSLISVQVKGLKGDGCQLVDSEIVIEGQNILIDTTIRGNPVAICPAVVVPLDFEEVIGALTPGTYQVSAKINGEASGPTQSFEVTEAQPGLRISPATGSFVEGQDFDLTLLVESTFPWTIAKAEMFGPNVGSDQRTDASEALLACIVGIELANGGRAYGCPGAGKTLGVGTHTLRVELRTDIGEKITDTVVWTVLEAKQ